MLIGESKAVSWRIHTPFCTTASTEQPTEQWLHTVCLTSIGAGPGALVICACASAITWGGRSRTSAATPAAMPPACRKLRRLTTGAMAGRGRARRAAVVAPGGDMRVNKGMRGSGLEAGELVVAPRVLALAIAAARVRLRCRVGRRGGWRHRRSGGQDGECSGRGRRVAGARQQAA